MHIYEGFFSPLPELYAQLMACQHDDDERSSSPFAAAAPGRSLLCIYAIARAFADTRAFALAAEVLFIMHTLRACGATTMPACWCTRLRLALSLHYCHVANRWILCATERRSRASNRESPPHNTSLCRRAAAPAATPPVVGNGTLAVLMVRIGGGIVVAVIADGLCLLFRSHARVLYAFMRCMQCA